MKKVVGAFAAFLYTTSALGGTLLPNGQQQFIDGNGKPYAAGKVWFYSNFPTCTVLKNTWQDSGNTTLNTNPITLDSAGRATIFGSGAYCQVLKDSLGNTIWTKYTADTSSAAGVSWGGTSGGTANAQTLTSSSFTGVDGQTIYFIAGYTNTGSMTLTISGSTIAVLKPTQSGPLFLTGGEVTANDLIGVTYISATGQFQLITNNLQKVPGEIKTFAGATCPAGWLAADGAVVSQTTYAALYSALGGISTPWNTGTEGAGNFRVPDLRGVFLRGSGTNGTGSSSGATGPAVGTYVADSYLNHSHAATSSVTDPGHTHTVGVQQAPYAAGASSVNGANSGSSNTTSSTTGISVSTTVATSTSGGTETKPKNYGVLQCIQY